MIQAPKRLVTYALIGIGCAAFLYAGSVLQRTTTDLFASPDETAVMLFARAWTWERGFRLPPNLPASLQALSLHPRSMVRQGDVLVPVGFLGMPMLIAMMERVLHGSGAYLTLILALSSAYPLWRLANRKGKRVAWLTVAFFLSFPTVLLYANRGLFPNLPVVALTIWAVYLAEQISNIECRMSIGAVEKTHTGISPSTFDIRHSRFSCAILTGLALGLAFIIRPVEAVWIVPWIAWGLWSGAAERGIPVRTSFRKQWRAYAIAGILLIAVCALAVVAAMRTYPFHRSILDQPVIGYRLHDVASAQDDALMTRAGTEETADADILPFGIHPRATWSNVRAYLFAYLGVWVAAALIGAFIAYRRRSDTRRLIFAGVCAWTVSALLLLYGQSAYADNIGGTVSLGNSFLRYLLPLVPLIAFGCAICADRLWRIRRRGALLGVSFSLFLVLFGVAIAFMRDEEGILRTRYELGRYVAIRRMTDAAAPAGSVIISERSDKIFASGPYAAISPIPDEASLEALHASEPAAYLFHRYAHGPGDLPPDVALVFGEDVTLLFTTGNEALYELKSADDSLFLPDER